MIEKSRLLARFYCFTSVTLLLAALAPGSFAQTTATTVDAKAVARLYSASLDRPPAVGGLNFFVDSLESGRTLVSIAEDFVLSAEFLAKYGQLNDRAYVEQLFLNVLGRPGAPGGIEFWQGNLSAGNSRAFVLAQFADSAENITNTGELYGSMEFLNGQWQFDFSTVEEVFALFCPGSKCAQVELKGSVGGADITVVPMDNPGSVTGTAVSADKDTLISLLGNLRWESLSDLERLSLLGIFTPPAVVEAQQYLVTSSGGMDYDNDLNLRDDEKPSPVGGVIHAIATGAQIEAGFQLNVMTESVFQIVNQNPSTTLDFEGVLDFAAMQLVQDIDGNNETDYRDVLQWSRRFDSARIRTELFDVNKFSLGINAGKDEETLLLLSDRMLSGGSALFLAEGGSVELRRGRTCPGGGEQSKTITSQRRESIITDTPPAVCDAQNLGKVESFQGDILGSLPLSSTGLSRDVEVNNTALRLSSIDSQSNTISIDYEDGSGIQRQATVPAIGPSVVQKLTSIYQLLREPAGVTQGSSLGIDSERLTVDFGTLTANWTACLVYQFIAQVEASGGSVAADVRSWAIDGCTSPLAGAENADEPGSAVRLPGNSNFNIRIDFDFSEVEAEGCEDCFSFIGEPDEFTDYFVGQEIVFNGVVSATSEVFFWDFGDGDTSTSRSPSHTYDEAGEYLVQFRVDYSDGSQGLSEVLVEVQ